jgi:hypothetical protein
MPGRDPRWYARGAWITYFEQLQQLRGMQNFLMDLASRPPELERLMDDLLAFNLAWIGRWTRLEYDGLHFADDWGSQTGLLVHPKLWRQLFKPRYAEMFQKVQQAGMDVWFHSDGKINEILPDLVEIGVTVINCQNRLVGHDWIAANLRGRVAFRTDIDRRCCVWLPSDVKAKCTGRLKPAAPQWRGHRLRRDRPGRLLRERAGDGGVP